jgi:hypothetical protein
MIKINKYQKISIIYFAGLLAFWLVTQLVGSKTGNVNFAYSFLFGLTPLFAGVIGMHRSKIWGRFRSSLGKAVFLISLGLFCWGFGETIWSYYNFFRHVAAPYPSLADIGFAPSVFFWVLGAGYLSKASGAWLALKRSNRAKIFAALAVIVLSAISYYLLIKVARGGVLVPNGETALKVILDVAYPLGDFLAAIFAFIVFMLSFKYFGGVYRPAIGAILAGLGTMYVADFVFSYATTVGTYYNGDWGDLILCLGLFLLSFGVLGFSTKPELVSIVTERISD